MVYAKDLVEINTMFAIRRFSIAVGADFGYGCGRRRRRRRVKEEDEDKDQFSVCDMGVILSRI